MSEFSEKMKDAIKKSRLTMPYLSEMCGLSVPNLYKICQGKRLPKEKDKMIALIQALQCPKSEELSLIQEYQIELFGKNEYYCLMTIHELFSRIGKIEKTGFFPSLDDPVYEPAVLHGKSECSSYLQQSLISEIQQERPEMIKIIGGEGNSYFLDSIQTVFSNSGAECCHILRLDSRSTPGSNLANLQLMAKVLPTAYSNRSYHPLYFYEYGKVRANRIQLFHSAVILRGQAMLFIDNCDKAIVIRDTEQLEFLGKLFDALQADSTPMVRHVSGLDGWERTLEKMAPDNRKRAPYLLQWDICALSVVDIDLLRRYICAPELESAARKLLERRKLPAKGPAVCYISKAGFDDFVRTGILGQLPEGTCEPLEPADRLLVLERIKDKWKAEKKLCFLNESRFDISRHLFVENFSESDSLIGFMEKGDRFSVYLQNEKGIASWAYHFLRYIEDSDFVLSREETMQYIEAAISELRKETANHT